MTIGAAYWPQPGQGVGADDSRQRQRFDEPWTAASTTTTFLTERPSGLGRSTGRVMELHHRDRAIIERPGGPQCYRRRPLDVGCVVLGMYS
jgi:hypothetical protein